MNKKLFICKIASLIFIVDQVLKFIIRKNLYLYQDIKVIPNFFSILYVENKGAAFSFFENNTIFLIIIGFVFLAIILFYLRKENNLSRLSSWSFSLLIGGVLGNLLDRVLFHVVIDYLSFNIFGYHFPVFNFADIAITCGVGIYIVDILSEGGRKHESISSNK